MTPRTLNRPEPDADDPAFITQFRWPVRLICFGSASVAVAILLVMVMMSSTSSHIGGSAPAMEGLIVALVLMAYSPVAILGILAATHGWIRFLLRWRAVRNEVSQTNRDRIVLAETTILLGVMLILPQLFAIGGNWLGFLPNSEARRSAAPWAIFGNTYLPISLVGLATYFIGVLFLRSSVTRLQPCKEEVPSRYLTLGFRAILLLIGAIAIGLLVSTAYNGGANWWPGCVAAVCGATLLALLRASGGKQSIGAAWLAAGSMLWFATMYAFAFTWAFKKANERIVLSAALCCCLGGAGAIIGFLLRSGGRRT